MAIVEQPGTKRTCDGCSLCCMVLAITELNKPKGKWCSHCTIGKGCEIYERQPTECEKFYCGWLTNEQLGDEWKPSKCKIVLVAELDGQRIAAHVHPKRPDAWMQEPYYSTLKHWAVAAAPHRGQVIACIDRRVVVILPDKDVDIGIVTDDDRIITGEKNTPQGVEFDAYRIHKDDPQIANLAVQNWNIAKKNS